MVNVSLFNICFLSPVDVPPHNLWIACQSGLCPRIQVPNHQCDPQTSVPCHAHFASPHRIWMSEMLACYAAVRKRCKFKVMHVRRRAMLGVSGHLFAHSRLARATRV